jgi:hypothetical protein
VVQISALTSEAQLNWIINVIPEYIEDANPESPDSGFALMRAPE